MKKPSTWPELILFREQRASIADETVGFLDYFMQLFDIMMNDVVQDAPWINIIW